MLPHLAPIAALLIAALPVQAAITFDIPQYEAPEDNAFDYYSEATQRLPEEPLWESFWDRLDEAPVEDLEMALANAGMVLETVRQGLGKPCVMPEVEDFTTPLPYLAGFRKIARALVVEGWVHSKRGEFAAAFGSHLDALTLGQDAARNGCLIHKLVSIACEAMACKAIRRTVGEAGDDAEALAGLVVRLQALGAREVPLSEAFALEYVGTRRSLEKMRDGDQANMQAVAGEAAGKVTIPVVSDALAKIDGVYSQLVMLATLDYWRQPEGGYQDLADNALLSQIVPATDKARARNARHQADLRGTLLVAALELYRAKHQAYPAQLADLAPEVVGELPADPFDGQPFRYQRRDPLTYALYSVGPDQDDDGGQQLEGAEATDGDLVFSAER